MAIIVNVDVMLAKRKMTSGELAEKVGITQANLSILKTGKAKAVRFSTLDALCKALDLTPMAVSADSYAAETKLTITVKVRFTNNVAPEESFEKTYSAYQTFDASQMLNDVQDQLCSTMITEIAEQIYNDTVAKW